ncbi:MAG: hypothetical protein AB1779_04845 [Candidatus Thermoplasmatota archaeon]
MSLDEYVRYIAGGIGLVGGWILSNVFLQLGARFTKGMTKVLGADPKIAWMGVGVACLIYIAIIGFGWKKGGTLGWFIAGFGVGALIEEIMSTFGV